MDQTRSEVLARNGIVATSNPLAVEAGLEILRQGGNAVDAAVAAAAALALVEANSTGIGADMFAQVWSARDKKLYGINANGWSPAAYDQAYLESMGCYPDMPTNGICSAMIPGAIDGFDKLLKRFGKFTFKEVLEPAARMAEEGFGIHEVFNNSLRGNVSNGRLTNDPDTAAIYLDENGEVPALYSIFKNPDMGHTFRVLQHKGVDAFYRGKIARAMVRKANAVGGVWTMDDLANYEAYWTEPLSINYKGYDFSQLPPPGQGWAALEMLNIIEACVPYHGYDLAELGRPNAMFTHFLVEAKKLAYSDLHRYNADPAFNPPPLDLLLSKDYAASLCDLIDPTAARPAEVQGNIDGGTIYLATADRWGNMVSLVYSTYSAFGGGITVPGYGFQFSSRGRGFTLGEPDHPNRPEGNKRPFITIIAGFIMKDGEPLMAIGNMGGGTQPQAHAQHMVNLIDLGFNVQATTDAARFDHDQFGDNLRLDHYLYEAVGAELAAMGHNVQDRYGLAGGYQGILFERDWSMPDPWKRCNKGHWWGHKWHKCNGHHSQHYDGPVNGIYRAGSDLRKDGMAAGW
jgi:gamma-glutamyltranspeptidase/glutathione hydrolase